MEKLEHGTLLNKASIAGAVFGLISGSYIFITSAMSAAEMGGLLSPVLWLAKFIGCIYLMIFFMKKLVKDFDGVQNSDTLKFGVLTALFSAIITAAASYIATEFVFPDLLDKQLNLVYQMYGEMLDSNSMAVLDKMTENYATISFFSQLIWCFIYGSILSVIISGKIPSQDPFKDFKDKENEAE